MTSLRAPRTASRRRRSGLLFTHAALLAATGAFALPVHSVFAQSVWLAGTGDWSTASNWDSGVPNNSTSALIGTDFYGNNIRSATVNITSPASSSDIRLGEYFVPANSDNIKLNIASTLSSTFGQIFANPHTTVSFSSGGSFLAPTGGGLRMIGGKLDYTGGTDNEGGALKINFLYSGNGSSPTVYTYKDQVNNVGLLNATGRVNFQGPVWANSFNYPLALTTLTFTNGGTIALNKTAVGATYFRITGSTPVNIDTTSAPNGGLRIMGDVVLETGASFQIQPGQQASVGGYGTTWLVNTGSTLINSSELTSGSTINLNVFNSSTLDLRAGILTTINANIGSSSSVLLKGGVLRITGQMTVDNATVSRSYTGAGIDLSSSYYSTAQLAVINGGKVTLQDGDNYVDGVNIGIDGANSTLTNYGTFSNTLGFLAVGNGGTLDLQAGLLRTNLLYLNAANPGSILHNGGNLWVRSATVTAGHTLPTAAGDTIPAGGTFSLTGSTSSNASWTNSATSSDIGLIALTNAGLDLRNGTLYTDNLSTSNSTIAFNGGNLVVKKFNVGGGTQIQRNTGSFTATELTVTDSTVFALESSDLFSSPGSRLVVTNNADLTFNAGFFNIFDSATISNGGTLHINSNYFAALDLYVGDTTPGILDRGTPAGTLAYRSLHVLAGSQVAVVPGDFVYGNGDLEVFGGSKLDYSIAPPGFYDIGTYNNVRVDASDLNLLPGGNVATKALSLGTFSHPSRINRLGGSLTIYNSITVAGGSALSLLPTDNLAAPLDFVTVKEASTLSLTGKPLDTNSLTIVGGSSVSRDAASTITVRNELVVSNASTFSVTPADTLAAGLTVRVLENSTLHVNNSPTAPIGNASVDSSTLDITGGNFHANSVNFSNGTLSRSPGSTFTTDYIVLATGTSNLYFLPGDQVNTLYLAEDTNAYLTQSPGDLTGLTLDSTLFLLAPSKLNLIFDSLDSSSLDWTFRWANPDAGGDHIAELTSLINAGSITITGHSYQVISQDGYTYIAAANAIPEPTTLALLLAPTALLSRRRR